jgi:two-component system LytT family response regulator
MQQSCRTNVASNADSIAPRESEDTIRVVIADDEPLARQLLVRLAKDQPGLSIVGLAENGDAAKRMIEEIRPDLVFLDVMMPGMTGIELMSCMNSRTTAPHVVFVTASDGFAIKAFDLDALDYLVKPIEKERFAKSVQRARKAICAKRVQRLGQEIAAVTSGESRPEVVEDPDRFVIIKQRDELIRIQESDIYWLEAASQYVRIHTKKAHYIVAESLNKYLARLSPELFVRVHRSAAVNVRHVNHVLRKQNGVHMLQLSNGVGVPLSRSRRLLVNDFLGVRAARNSD